MGSSVNGLGVLSVVALLALGAWAVTPATGAEPVMCEPVTIEDLFADEPEEEADVDTTAPTTTTPPTTTTTTGPTTTTTGPTTTTTGPTTTTTGPTSTTTTGPTSTTTGPTTTTTTTAPTTTSPSTTDPSDPTTTEPDTTTTTAGPSTTTTSPSTTTTAPSPTSTTAPTTTTTEPPCDTPFVYPMEFPFSGAGTIGSPFGAPRDGGQRHHLGNDIAAPILQPVVAVADGTVSVIAGDTGISGYRIHIRHDDGWSSLYIHLNNDTAGTDDGNGIGIRPDLAEGDRVEAGDVIGWNGDSGNAESTEPHLHFELRDPSGTSVDPRASLEAAAQSEDRFTGPFSDLAVEEYETDAMVLLLSRGMSAWCGNGTTACPDKPATEGDLSVWLASLLDAPVVECDPECTGVTEADLARALAWARMADAEVAVEDIPDGRVTAPPPAPPDSPADLGVREAHRLLGGPDRCLSLPNEERDLTRRQAAETLVLYLGWTESLYCPTSSANR